MSEAIELIDLGDATEETRQAIDIPLYWDSILGWGLFPG